MIIMALFLFVVVGIVPLFTTESPLDKITRLIFALVSCSLFLLPWFFATNFTTRVAVLCLALYYFVVLASFVWVFLNLRSVRDWVVGVGSKRSR
jgi:hypothetical protein